MECVWRILPSSADGDDEESEKNKFHDDVRLMKTTTKKQASYTARLALSRSSSLIFFLSAAMADRHDLNSTRLMMTLHMTSAAIDDTLIDTHRSHGRHSGKVAVC